MKENQIDSEPRAAWLRSIPSRPKKETLSVSHTLGPWFHIPRNRDGHVDVITDREGSRQRAFVSVGSPQAEHPILDYPHDNVQTANARLIAAAPELLAVIEGFLAFGKIEGDTSWNSSGAQSFFYGMMRAAGKARGRHS